jgi:HJR/Mrr/RecB family endonuclease
MTSRSFWFSNHGRAIFSSGWEADSTKQRRAYWSLWILLVALTVLLAFWLGFRWLGQPGWLDSLPSFILEVIRLMELAGTITLLFLWGGLLLYRRRQKASPGPRSLSRDQLYSLSPKAFEHYVAGLFRYKGYHVIVRGRSGDHGVDLELSGRDGRRAVVQCKRYRETVGEQIIRDLYGTLIHEAASHAFLVTTAEISDAAEVWAKGKPITLIDGPTLVHIGNSLASYQDQIGNQKQ